MHEFPSRLLLQVGFLITNLPDHNQLSSLCVHKWRLLCSHQTGHAYPQPLPSHQIAKISAQINQWRSLREIVCVDNLARWEWQGNYSSKIYEFPKKKSYQLCQSIERWLPKHRSLLSPHGQVKNVKSIEKSWPDHQGQGVWQVHPLSTSALSASFGAVS